MTKTTKWLDLLINGKSRKAEAMKENDLYVVTVPAAELVDGSGTGELSPAVQGHRAVFDKDGVLLGVDALGWNAEGGFYKTNWPTKADSLYNANAAKTYAPQVFKQVKKNGGWLQAYKSGGKTQEQEQMLLLLALVDAAYGELQQEKPGRSLQYLLQLMLDPQGAQMLEVLKTQVPEVQDVLDHIELASLTSTFKKGGCVKSKVSKKVKKGAKGCVPCKRLMRVGGKLVNVWSDCEGNVIHKHLIGGWIRKGSTGFNTLVLNSDFTKAKTGTTGTPGQVHYYLDANGRWLLLSWQDGVNGNPGSWSTGTSEYDANAFQEWRNANANNIFKTGFTANWDNYSGTFDTQENAITALGLTEFDKGWTSKTVRGVTGEKGNTWLGTEAKDPTAQDYVNLYGLQGALLKESRLRAARLLLAKNDKRAARRSAWENGLVGSGQLKSIRTAWENQRDAIKSQHKALAANLINTYTSKNPTFVTTPDITVGQSTTAQSPVNTTSTQTGTDDYKVLKNGGWLTKF